MLVRLRQPLNAPIPMLVIVEGSVAFSRLIKPLKASRAMLVIPSSITRVATSFLK